MKFNLKIYYRFLLYVGILLLMGSPFIIRADNIAEILSFIGLIMTLIGIVVFFIDLIKNPKIKTTKFTLGLFVFVCGCIVYAVLKASNIQLGFMGGFIFMYAFLFIFAKATGWNLFKRNKKQDGKNKFSDKK